MSKLYRTSKAPAGADIELRNPRLYGSRDEQVQGAALRARGCPSPDRAYVPARSRQSLAAQRDREAHARRLQAAQTTMLAAQRAVREAKRYGHPTDELAEIARRTRAAYLRLSGGVERKTVDASTGADGTKV